jgi:hypothetical protein
MRIPFVGPSNTARSYNAAVERAVNCYLEKNDDPDRPWVLYGTPGMTLRATLGVAAPRGAIEMGSLTYWVSGNTVYKMTSGYVATSLGTIGTSTGRVGMATNGTEVLIVDGNKGWLATSTTLTEIVDVDFPDGVTVALYLDSYFLVFGDGTQVVYYNETPGSGTAWNGLDFGSAEGSPDILRGGVVDNRTAWLVGSRSAELWRTTTDAAAPIQRMDGMFIEQGTASGWTVAKLDNAVYWLSESENGDGVVLRSGGSSPERVSTHSLEAAISGYATISDAFAFSVIFQGHSWYVLTFPTADATWVYDAATSQWTEWLWYDEANNEFHRHRAVCHVFANRKHLVGDWETGEVYSLELDVYKDAGDTIKRLRRTQTLRKGAGRLFFGDLDIEIETGVANADCAAPQVMYRYSNDDGHSWSNEKIRSIGATGEYGKRVKVGPTGATKTGKGRVHELSMTDPVKFALFGADVNVEAGS